MSPEPPLDRATAHLTELTAHAARDAYLAELIEDAEQRGIPKAIGLFTNGMIVLGLLASSGDLAKALDEDHHRLFEMDRPESIPEEKWEAAKTTNPDWYQQLHEQIKADAEQGLAELEEHDPETPMPADVETRAIRAQICPFLCLRNVQIISPANPTLVTRVPVMRVRVDQVAAWWAPEFDYQAGRASVTLFQPNEDVRPAETGPLRAA